MNEAVKLQPGQSVPLIYKKMIQVMSEIGPISKEQENKMQKFRFRGIDQFLNAIHPVLVKHGVFMVPECLSHSHELKEVKRADGRTGIDKHTYLSMRYTFYAEDGSHLVVGPIPAEGLDSGDKSTTKALSAALKYTLIQTFTTPTEDMGDADSESPEIGKGQNEYTPEFVRQQCDDNFGPPPGHPAAPVAQVQQMQPPTGYAQKNTYRKPSEAQLRRLFAKQKAAGISDAEVKAYIAQAWKRESRSDLSLSEYDQLCDKIDSGDLQRSSQPEPEKRHSSLENLDWYKNSLPPSDPRMVK